MTPLFRVLESYFGPRTSLAVLTLIYTILIIASCMSLGRLQEVPMFYLDVH